MPADTAAYVKIGIRAGDGHVETPWALPVGRDQYRLDNIPFYAYGLSADDVVEAHPEADGMLMFTAVAHKSGNRTIRVLVPQPHDAEPGLTLLPALERLGCSFERASGKLVCVNVPPTSDLPTVADELVRSGVEWEYADPTYDDLFPTDGSPAAG